MQRGQGRPPKQEESWELPEVFEYVAVYFSRKEWELLEDDNKRVVSKHIYQSSMLRSVIPKFPFSSFGYDQEEANRSLISLWCYNTWMMHFYMSVSWDICTDHKPITDEKKWARQTSANQSSFPEDL
ncbi:hypothetical protein Y1Q_0020604 [Alligator mississippiensis]|uniref:KRAB domain-containing protein n=1 Tax=Alligator mississippiensis TaxID=8496 RepID=A0A151NVZ7_ALLMI|nr:hypothetical protein Y1Q_0020604 [Alligator mississippiensis]